MVSTWFAGWKLKAKDEQLGFVAEWTFEKCPSIAVESLCAVFCRSLPLTLCWIQTAKRRSRNWI